METPTQFHTDIDPQLLAMHSMGDFAQVGYDTVMPFQGLETMAIDPDSPFAEQHAQQVAEAVTKVSLTAEDLTYDSLVLQSQLNFFRVQNEARLHYNRENDKELSAV